MKIKIRCFKVLLWPKKNHRSTIKICRLQIWKKRCTIDGKLNMYYIWQNKAMIFSQYFIQEVALDRSACSSHSLLLWSNLFNHFSFCLIFGIDSFFEGITNIMTGQYFLLEPFYIHSMNSIISAQKAYI